MKKSKKPAYLTQHTYTCKPGKIFTQESLTVPGEAFTIQELLDRANAGVPLQSLVRIHDEKYVNNDDFDLYTNDGDLDISDIHNIAEFAHDTIQEAKDKLKHRTPKEDDLGTTKDQKGVKATNESKAAKNEDNEPQPDD